MRPTVKTYKVSFYHEGQNKPYAQIWVDAPTKLLARLNLVHDADLACSYVDALRQQPARITYGVVKSR